MPRIKRTRLADEAERRKREQLTRVGRDVRASRSGRRLTQAQLGQRAGVGRMVISRVECGIGGGGTLDAWQRIGLAVNRPLVIGLQRDVDGETADAGHLAMQELVLRTARLAGFAATFELATRPAEPWRSVDVGLRDNRRRALVLVECWNSVGDVGAAVRVSDRKQVECEALATLWWGGTEARVAQVWLMRATARNRALVRRYPEVFASRFPGPSAAWISVLTRGASLPSDRGLVWCDLAGTRLFAWRRFRPPLEGVLHSGTHGADREE